MKITKLKIPSIRVPSDAELDVKYAERREKRRKVFKASKEKWETGPKGEAYRRAQKAKKIKL